MIKKAGKIKKALKIKKEAKWYLMLKELMQMLNFVKEDDPKLGESIFINVELLNQL